MTHILSPHLIRECLGRPDALVAPAKVYMCTHKGPEPTRTVIGAVALGDFVPGGEWEMVVGNLIVVPHKRFVWADGMCGWELSDLIEHGGGMEHWKEAEKQ